MAAPILKTLRSTTGTFLSLSSTSRSYIKVLPQLGFSLQNRREYSKKKSHLRTKRPNDPRFNIQYPYVRGDPIQEEKLRHHLKAKEKFTITPQPRSNHLKQISRQGDLSDPSILQALEKPVISTIPASTTVSGLSYTKLKDGDLRLGRTILSIKSKLSTESSKLILLEGQRLIRDSLLLGAELQHLYFCDEALLQALPTHLLTGIDLFKVLYRDLKTWSDTSTPPGIMGVFKKPDQGQVMCPPEEAFLPITIILDSVKDPGNVGTLIRTAAAIGCERILALKGCVNVWEGKVVRSGMGAHFAVPIYTGLEWPHVYSYIDDKSQVLLAEPKPQEDPFSPSGYENLQDQLEAHEKQEIDEPSSDSSDDEVATTSSTGSGKHKDRLFDRVPLPLLSYSDVNVQGSDRGADGGGNSGSSSICLVVGGETKGLSPTAKKFAYDYYGQYISLPMTKHIDSLNTAVAASVILYELRRKLLMNSGS